VPCSWHRFLPEVAVAAWAEADSTAVEWVEAWEDLVEVVWVPEAFMAVCPVDLVVADYLAEPVALELEVLQEVRVALVAVDLPD
jgi:hypothetical protein